MNTQQPVSNSSITLVNTSSLANGLYIVRVKGGTNFNYYTKLIKLN
ncbi:MAG: T9SS type A sorting domain-containing protein [Bacteroidia bacterium]|nr:T9SS type A sorting domain-containing protein [Bacteroidia bacterium]